LTGIDAGVAGGVEPVCHAASVPNVALRRHLNVKLAAYWGA
jgi:hypothetical protein